MSLNANAHLSWMTFQRHIARGQNCSVEVHIAQLAEVITQDVLPLNINVVG